MLLHLTGSIAIQKPTSLHSMATPPPQPPPPPPPPPQPQPPPNLDEYSPSATLITFDHPIPLLRGPIPASPTDDPTSGQYLLAFKDPQSWSKSYKTCRTQITQQFESGARIGCSIAASNKCKTPWWKTILGLSKEDFAERAQCEEREMQACVSAAQERCREFAERKCSPAFKEARVRVNNELTRSVKIADRRDAGRLISWVCLGRKIGLEKSWDELKAQFDVGYCRGRDLMDSGDIFESSQNLNL